MRLEKYESGTPSWVGLSRPDVEASKRFYGDLFGWSADSDPRPDSGNTDSDSSPFSSIQRPW